MPDDDPMMVESEKEILDLFSDVQSLFPRQRAEDEAVEVRHGTEEYLFPYLRDLDAKGGSLPALFMTKLKRVLAHYGVEDLQRTPELETSLYRIARAHQQIEQQVLPVISILERRLDARDAIASRFEGPAGEGFRDQLARLITVTQGVLPSVTDSAREVRYRYFGQPLLEAARREACGEAEAHLEVLAENPDADDRAERIQALVKYPQPLQSVLSCRFATASPDFAAVMLEVMTRRYYRIRHLENVQATESEGRLCVTAEYDHEGDHIHLIPTHAPYETIKEAAWPRPADRPLSGRPRHRRRHLCLDRRPPRRR